MITATSTAPLGLRTGTAAALGHLAAVPPPPTAEQRRAELAKVHELTDHRTPELDARAIELDVRGAWGIWQDEARELRQHVGFLRGAVGTLAMEAAIGAAALRAARAKSAFDAPRPFELDPTITPLGPIPRSSSYPSGHAAAAAAAAAVLAHYWPERRARYEALAAQVAWARVYSGVHFPSDVQAGAALGRATGNAFVRGAQG